MADRRIEGTLTEIGPDYMQKWETNAEQDYLKVIYLRPSMTTSSFKVGDRAVLVYRASRSSGLWFVDHKIS